MKYFTLEEAQGLLPQLETIREAIERIRSRAQDKQREAERLENAMARPEDAAIAKAQLEFLVGSIQDWLMKVEAFGCVPKGLDPFLVDFPFRFDGRELYLCWKAGESEIEWYHPVESGYAGRRRLPAEVRRQAR